ncbi:hypothetical protein CTRI78_v007433 [Colletotrichum trifolii]|uniref:Uncharacterized protein n=1 Tax=Colletotrichum trifolii TaxID=5466 RepID=A0A4R8R6B8_COLTR|nr:hypothetical protein CTRI78_v007433 [Colletotrichum trifolii]
MARSDLVFLRNLHDYLVSAVAINLMSSTRNFPLRVLGRFRTAKKHSRDPTFACPDHQPIPLRSSDMFFTIGLDRPSLFDAVESSRTHQTTHPWKHPAHDISSAPVALRSSAVIPGFAYRVSQAPFPGVSDPGIPQDLSPPSVPASYVLSRSTMPSKPPTGHPLDGTPMPASCRIASFGFGRRQRGSHISTERTNDPHTNITHIQVHLSELGLARLSIQVHGNPSTDAQYQLVANFRPSLIGQASPATILLQYIARWESSTLRGILCVRAFGRTLNTQRNALETPSSSWPNIDRPRPGCLFLADREGVWQKNCWTGGADRLS